MQRLTHRDFRVMPWKNGGGTTLELFHIQDNEGDTLLRLSRAKVTSDGPFSLFPGLERLLMVLSGEGLQLDLAGELIELRQGDEALRFAGELTVHSDLIEGPVEDFNVMIDRNYGHAEIQLHRTSFTAPPSSYIYLPERQELWVLETQQALVELKNEVGIEVRVSITDPH